LSNDTFLVKSDYQFLREVANGLTDMDAGTTNVLSLAEVTTNKDRMVWYGMVW